MDIRIYRERPSARKVKRSLEQFWADLQAKVGPVG